MNHSNDPISLESPNRTLYDNLTDGNWSGYDDANRTSGANLQETEYIFDRPDVQAIFIILYTIVFCSCFFGNLLVILVVTLHWRMRSITNFCLANLAFADLCVGVFCVYQNLSTYLIASWVFGNFLCKMYHFINSLSHTASILILVVICVERYLAIIHPMRCKQMLTLNRLRLTVVAVWILSAILSSPRLYYIDTWTIPRNDGETEVICAPKRTLYDSVSLDLISMLVLFICPLIALTLLYTRIGVALWRSSRNQMSHPSASETSSSNFSGYDAHTEHAAVQVAKESRGCFFCCIRGRRRTRRRHQSRQPSYFYDGSTAQTSVVCYHCNGMTGFDGVPEDNGNHQRQFCVCTQCVMEDGSNGRVNGLWNSNGNHVKNLSPFSNNCRASGRRRRERGSEPLIVVKFKKRENNCARNGMNQCSIHLHSPNGNSDCAEMDASVRTQIYGSDLVTADQRMDKHPCCCCTGQRNCDRAADVSGISNGDGTLPNEVGKLNGGSLLGAGQQCCHQCGSRINGSHLGETSPRPARPKRMRVIRSSKYGTRALRSRRRIIRMLIIIVVTFAICNLPFHARKMWQNYSSSYRGGSNFSSIFTPVTFLIMYANSGINPLLYAFMSHKFRLSFRDLLYCKLRRSLRMSRRQSGRSTHIVPISTAV